MNILLTGSGFMLSSVKNSGRGDNGKICRDELSEGLHNVTIHTQNT